jgi:nicotinate-nucleotide pyrophosphorylase (carboxylating)
MKLSKEKILEYLAEDGEDITTKAIPQLANKICEFYFISKNTAPFILCGVDFLRQILEAIGSKNFVIEQCKKDGNEVSCKEFILKGKANARDFLLAERTALNLMQQLSAVSTKTNEMKKALEGSKIQILDTRKTIPALRALQKYAVRCGGGQNHRFGLHDLVMIKDNHIKASGGVRQAITSVLKANLQTKIEVECESLEDVKEAIKHPIHIIMLDNMSVEQMQEASKIIRTTNIKIEVSGGVSPQNIRSFKELDVDFISSGSLTHSITAVDISAKILI